jgi:SAM-dependent methyltransferase
MGDLREREHPPFSVGIAVGVISGAALGFQILLIRLFSIVEWHHLAFLVISLALLGYGASGTLLALAREPMLRRFEATAGSAAAAFGATSIGSFVIAQRIELNSLEIFWSTRQFGTLFVLYLLFAVPFFCAATAIGLALTRYGSASPRLYRADLIGGGASAALVTAVLFVIHPSTALQIIAAVGFLAAILFAPRRGAIAVALIGIVAVVAARPLVLPLRMSQFKELSHALRVPGAVIADERSSPLGLLTSVSSPMVPFRHAPGLSLAFEGEIPEQIGVFTDGGGMTPIVLYRNDPAALEYLGFIPTAVAYHTGARRKNVAVIGAGGGAEVLSALVHGAERVTAVELNRQMVELVETRFARESGGLYAHDRINVVNAEARQFIRETGERFDVIQLALVGSHGASAAGVQALSESYLYTVEAMAEMIEHLAPGGYLVVTRWMQAPPREVIKLLATAIEALERAGGPQREWAPSQQLALIRGWNTATLIIRNGAFEADEVAMLRRFADNRSFDLEYAPGVVREETNQYNLLEEPYLFDAATALLAGGAVREDFYRRYKFHVRPATDERPYFFHSFQWSALPELLQLRARGGMPLLEWGYLVLVAGLAQALVAAVVLILLPLVFVRHGKSANREPVWRLVVYFGSIGLAFLFVEIAFMQRLTLFLGNPLYAIAVVLSSFLFFGGFGSGVAARVSERRAAIVPVIVAVAAIAGLVLVRALTTAAVGLGGPAKIAISVALVAPLAFGMGMPFPLALRRLAATDRAAIPWAWGINGTASVLSSMLATLVAVHYGFSILVALAAALYAIAATGFPRAERVVA